MDLSTLKPNVQANAEVTAERTVVTSNETETETTEPGQKIIESKNPTPEEMKALCENIKVNHDFKVDVKPIKFNFKKQVDKDTGLETVRKPLELAIPFPSVEGIVDILSSEDPKELELLMDAVEGVITQAARDIISEDYNVNASNFPWDKITWKYIANLPKAQRRGGGIPKETWEEFAEDYIAVMPAITGKSVDQVTNAAKIFLNRLANVKTNEPVLNLLVEQLAVYADNSKRAEEFTEVIQFLLEKAETFLNTSPEELTANL